MSQEDLEAIRQDYLTSLQDLTANSRPIISTLTIIAQENIHAAKIITKTIEDHISKTSPHNKLYGLYLLDSICKNVGKPYTVYFGLNLYRVFCDAYTLVNDSIRRKMYELFLTWKQPTANGTLLFDNVPMNKLESFLNKAQQSKKIHAQPPPSTGSSASSSATSSFSHDVGGKDDTFRQARLDLQGQMRAFSSDRHMTQPELTHNVECLLHLAEQRRSADPSDVNTTKQLNILNQLRDQLASKSFQNDVLALIKNQLAAYTSEELERVKDSPSIATANLALPSSPRPMSAKPIPTGPAGVATSSPTSSAASLASSFPPALLQASAAAGNSRKNKRKNKNQLPQQQLNLTPVQLQQLQQIVSMSNQPQQPQNQYNMGIPQQQQQQLPGVFPNAAAAILNNSNPYFQQQQQPPQPQGQQGMFMNGQGYDLMSALQGIANIQAAAAAVAAVAPAPIPPKPYMAQLQPYGVPPQSGGLRGGHSSRLYKSNSIPTGPAGLNSGLPYGSPLQANPGMNNGANTTKKVADLTAMLQSIDLTPASLNKPRPDLIGLLYSSMPKRCSTCGKRFPDTPEGRKVREAHSDWHFRVNKKLRDENWTQVRSWFLTEEEWVKHRDESETHDALQVPVAVKQPQQQQSQGKSRNRKKNKANGRNKGNNAGGNNAGGSQTSAPSGAGSNSIPSLVKLSPAELQAKYVPVPADKYVAGMGCGICKEKFKTSFNADTEEWVWKNAVRVLGRYFHATCFAEAERSSGGADFVKRIAGESAPLANGNSAADPAPSSSAPPSVLVPGSIDLTAILASVKRKRDETEGSAETSETATGEEVPTSKREKVE